MFLSRFVRALTSLLLPVLYRCVSPVSHLAHVACVCVCVDPMTAVTHEERPGAIFGQGTVTSRFWCKLGSKFVMKQIRHKLE